MFNQSVILCIFWTLAHAAAIFYNSNCSFVIISRKGMCTL